MAAGACNSSHTHLTLCYPAEMAQGLIRHQEDAQHRGNGAAAVLAAFQDAGQHRAEKHAGEDLAALLASSAVTGHSGS